MDNRSEIRDLMISRRARLSPQQAGLPAGGTRRVPGLRRSGVAQLAGVSLEHYTRLERGNLSGASDSVLDAVGRALRLDDAERAHLGKHPRRAILLGAVGTLAGTLLGACTGSPEDAPTAAAPATPSAAGNQSRSAPATSSSGSGKVLLAYFSRAGENYFNGGRKQLSVGNTEVVAGLIGRRIGCDVYRIEAADRYPDDYEETVARNVREQNANARPGIANPLASIERYDTILLGSPIWNVRAPMIMTTFVEQFSFNGRTIHPLTTYAMSGLGTTERDYAASCPGATIAEGLAVRGEEIAGAEPAVDAWLRRTGLLTR
ncbi:flavodoxin [Dactylosporangium sp. NPDC049140]|uniref:flavodoxin n=1 Tax=Dactylosporangium sp. NPDC049140 TaxID=3155647 RepID=UPI0034077752